MILVLGSTGFLGSWVCKLLTQRKIDWYGASRATGVDLRVEDQTNALFEQIRPSAVINCASYVGGVQFGLQHPVDLFMNNLKMTINTYAAIGRFSVGKIINPISNCTYPGSAACYRVHEWWNGPMHDSVLTYGFVKKAIWIASQAYRQESKIIANHVILPNMYGPGDHLDLYRAHALGALVSRFVNAKRNNQTPVTVWGTGSPIREWLHIKDGAEALIRTLDLDIGSDPINVGRGEGISIKDLACKIRDVVGVKCEIEFDRSKPDGAAIKTIDGTTGERALNWRPQIELDAGLRETVQWYSENA